MPYQKAFSPINSLPSPVSQQFAELAQITSLKTPDLLEQMGVQYQVSYKVSGAQTLFVRANTNACALTYWKAIYNPDGSCLMIRLPYGEWITLFQCLVAGPAQDAACTCCTCQCCACAP